MKSSFAFAVAALVSLNLSAQAATGETLARIESGLKACLAEPEHDDNASIGLCNDQAAAAADRLLTRNYAALSAELRKKSGEEFVDEAHAEALKRLVGSQKAWNVFREADSSLRAASWIGGNGEGLQVLKARYAMTVARIRQLDKIRQDIFN